jgi:ParB/RepB/Spo0J family partition protein
MANIFASKKAAQKDQQVQRLKSLNDLTLDQSAQNEEPSEKKSISSNGILVMELDPSECYALQQVRTVFSEEEVNDRAASMRHYGQLTPINVRPKDATGRYLILNGECRWRAAQTIPGFKLKAVVIPRDASHSESDEIILQLIENVQRSDLQPLEIARACAVLREKGLSQKQIALQIGWTTGAGQQPNIDKVSRYLSLLDLPEEGQDLVESAIVLDMHTLIYLRKIHELDPATFTLLCDAARREEGLNRSRAKTEYEKLKKLATQEIQFPSDDIDTDGHLDEDTEVSNETMRDIDWSRDFDFDDGTENSSVKSTSKSNETQNRHQNPSVLVRVNGKQGILVITAADKKGLLTVEVDGQRMRVKPSDISIVTVQ